MRPCRGWQWGKGGATSCAMPQVLWGHLWEQVSCTNPEISSKTCWQPGAVHGEETLAHNPWLHTPRSSEHTKDGHGDSTKSLKTCLCFCSLILSLLKGILPGLGSWVESIDPVHLPSLQLLPAHWETGLLECQILLHAGFTHKAWKSADRGEPNWSENGAARVHLKQAAASALLPHQEPARSCVEDAGGMRCSRAGRCRCVY